MKSTSILKIKGNKDLNVYEQRFEMQLIRIDKMLKSAKITHKK